MLVLNISSQRAAAASQPNQNVTNSVDPTHGATNFVFYVKGQLWHPIGAATQLTTWSGPFINGAGHPAEVYMTFWKQPDSSQGAEASANLVPLNTKVIQTLGTTFYYPADAAPAVDPAVLGYKAGDFTLADRLMVDFPNIPDLFTAGMQVSGCHLGNNQFFLIRGYHASAAYLVAWQAANQGIDVAVMPAKILTGSFESILDNVNYYANGGMAEIMQFGAYFYYLSRLPQDSRFDAAPNGTSAQECPDTPKATPTGMYIPKSWTAALKSLKSQP